MTLPPETDAVLAAAGADRARLDVWLRAGGRERAGLLAWAVSKALREGVAAAAPFLRDLGAYDMPAQAPPEQAPRAKVWACSGTGGWRWSVLGAGDEVLDSGDCGTKGEADRAALDAIGRRDMKTWECGVTTVPERQDGLLPRTLASLAAAGFPKPRLFVDGSKLGDQSYRAGYGLEATTRWPRCGAFLNWWLALVELYGRNPMADRYAIFQDDLVCVGGLRAYLDRCRFPDGRDGRRPGYWNLFTFLDAENVITRPGWVEGPMLNAGQDPAQTFQSGRGALALVFDREGVQVLLASRPFVNKPATAEEPRAKIDGGVVNAMNLAGRREYVHGPSLVAHTGTTTSIQEPGKAGKVWQSNARSFPGEGVDIREVMAGKM